MGCVLGTGFALRFFMNACGEKDPPRCGGERVRLHGVLIPSVWDEKGHIVRVALATHDEEEFMIFPDIMGKEALGMVRREVEVTGVLEAGPDGTVLRIEKVHPAD